MAVDRASESRIWRPMRGWGEEAEAERDAVGVEAMADQVIEVHAVEELLASRLAHYGWTRITDDGVYQSTAMSPFGSDSSQYQQVSVWGHQTSPRWAGMTSIRAPPGHRPPVV